MTSLKDYVLVILLLTFMWPLLLTIPDDEEVM